jgi:hypothetical protein
MHLPMWLNINICCNLFINNWVWVHILFLDQTKPYLQFCSCWHSNNLGSIIMENITKDASPKSINSEQPYRTGYHFQPLKNWMNGKAFINHYSFTFSTSSKNLSIGSLYYNNSMLISNYFHFTCFVDQNSKSLPSSCRS